MNDDKVLDAIYERPEVVDLLRLLQPATRAQPVSDRETYVPPTGGEIAEADYHHFVFGQRGSGKSSLLRHLQSIAENRGRISIWIDQEIFSNMSYPDVLVSAVHEVINGIVGHLEKKVGQQGKSNIIRRILRRPKKSDAQLLLADLSQAASELQKLKFAPIDRRVEWVVVDESTTKDALNMGLQMKLVTGGATAEESHNSSVKATEVVEGTKDQYLERALTLYRELLVRSSSFFEGGFVFIDDLYQLRRADQPLVLGYMHRLAKDTGIWLKIGSIRYSTVTYKPGDPPRGMQVGHDAHEVPLDRGLRHLQSTQKFLEQILTRIATKVSVDIRNLITDEARKRLVLAAGGVARDYLRLVSGSINEARNRGVSSKSGSHRIIVEDVNKAAGMLSPSKIEDLKKDEPAEAADLERLVRRITEFCRSKKSAYFLVSTDEVELCKQIDKLQNLRFTHLLIESETIPDRGSQRFNIWLLDVAELSAQRATTGVDFLSWTKREKRRNRSLIFVDDKTTQMEISDVKQ